MPEHAAPYRSLALVLAALALAGCGGGGGGAASSAPPTAPPSTSAGPSASAGTSGTPSAPSEDGSRPVRVEIPALGVDAAPIDLGIGDDGELEVPSDPDDVGWYVGGGRPGERGPTVVVGHVDATDGPAVFADLATLDPGDTVVVHRADGRAVTYVVERAEAVEQDRFPTELVFGATADDQLRLITCTGPYDRAAGRYTQNHVVFARP
ncbi:class F sortase [Nocardioides zeae]|uniref:LPXTG-site transpeptidase (Sortase) family protein n=1 Tax=Nocardioides zeae TaxID=1457234 RepID=A0AAJ1X2Y2_9ACTN|nr:class F sortase [Nocardioides zeae]MDQ1105039.1 LPXTG-site transpeptidase (sortase) family protein [Nocardioides zeae]